MDVSPVSSDFATQYSNAMGLQDNVAEAIEHRGSSNQQLLLMGIKRQPLHYLGLCFRRSILPLLDGSDGRLPQNRISPDQLRAIDTAIERHPPAAECRRRYKAAPVSADTLAQPASPLFSPSRRPQLCENSGTPTTQAKRQTSRPVRAILRVFRFINELRRKLI
jgi:hypothetical protein